MEPPHAQLEPPRPDGTESGPAPEQKVGATLNAPMPGIVHSLPRRGRPGRDRWRSCGVVLEAMKMENTLPSPIDGRGGPLPLEPGATVKKEPGAGRDHFMNTLSSGCCSQARRAY